MQQERLFHEDIYEALRTDILALGGFKKVGSMLWPEKLADKAGENLNNCLNRTRPEKLDAEQILLIKREAKKVGSFAALLFEMDDIGMSHPTPIEPEDEYAKLQREFIHAQEEMGRMLKRMESLSDTKLRAIK